MTAKRITAPRLKRGRPRRDDQIVVDMAAALRVVFGLGRQRARDQALAWLEGQQVTPTRMPRGARKAAPYSELIGYKLPTSFEGRAKTIRGKHLKPRPDVVLALAELLRALVRKDTAAIVRAFMQLKRTK